MLDVPLCFDPLAPNPYAVNRPQDTLYTALVAAATGASKWSEVSGRAQLTLACTPDVVSQALTHPVTGAQWFVRGGQVFEVGRRGTQYRLASGQCLPSYGGRACPVGQWAPPNASRCVDCGGAEGANASAAWRQQCANVGAGAARRLLQEAPKQTIHLIVVSARADLSAGEAAAMLRRAVGDGVCTCMAAAVGGTWRVAYECLLTEVRSPSDALRALWRLVVPGVLDYVAPPSVGWSRNAATTSADAPGPDVGLIVGATAAGVLGVVLVVGLFVWVLRPGAAYQPVATGHR